MHPSPQPGYIARGGGTQQGSLHPWAGAAPGSSTLWSFSPNEAFTRQGPTQDSRIDSSPESSENLSEIPLSHRGGYAHPAPLCLASPTLLRSSSLEPSHAPFCSLHLHVGCWYLQDWTPALAHWCH